MPADVGPENTPVLVSLIVATVAVLFGKQLI